MAGSDQRKPHGPDHRAEEVRQIDRLHGQNPAQRSPVDRWDPERLPVAPRVNDLVLGP